MKYTRILRIFGAALILSLLLAVIPTAPALAFDYEISLSPTQGKVGDTIHVNGSSFTPSTDSSEKHARIIFSSQQVITGKNIDIDVTTYKIVGDAIIGYSGDTDEGEFSTTFTVPSSLTDGSTDADVAPGNYYVYVVMISGSSTSTLIKSVASFTVTPGAVGGGGGSGTVTGTVSTELLSLTVSDGSVAYGNVALGGTRSTLELQPTDTQTITNTGSMAEKLEVKCSDATGGVTWYLVFSSVSERTDEYAHQWSGDGGQNWNDFLPAHVYDTLNPSLAASGTQALDLKIYMPTSTSDTLQKSITVTVLAAVP